MQWECKASLPDGVLFGEIQVTCEGYDFPEDPYVLLAQMGDELLGASIVVHTSSTERHYQYLPFSTRHSLR